MNTFILIMVLATSSFAQSGAASISQEFSSEASCVAAGTSLSQDAAKRGNFVLTWGCFKK